MIQWLKKLLGAGTPKMSFKKVDWLEADGKLNHIRALAQSPQQADAKQVIIQADILVDSLMKQAGVPGQTMGERLKALKQDLPRDIYQSLWQAHLKRNELVHEPNAHVENWEKTEYFHAFQEAVKAFKRIR